MTVEDYLLIIYKADPTGDANAQSIPAGLMTAASVFKSYRLALDSADECDSFDGPALIYTLWKAGVI